jgi:PspAA-like protein
VIVRLMGEGQFRVDDDLLSKLNELDDKAQAAADGGDEPELDRVLDEMWSLVQADGERLADDDLHPSDVLIPPSDLTLEETQRLFSDQGLIPDIPAAT